ncbi:MAG: adenosylmethionine--8-amino-7-oxononanoate transaminase [bacterium]
MTLEKKMHIDRDHVWHPYASISAPPAVNFAVSAHGAKIRLEDGTELIDAISSWWCVAHGHNHPVIVDAIREQAERMTHVMFAGFTHEPAIKLADALMKQLPAGLDKIFFTDSGSIAVECAAKMAVQYQLARGHEKRSRLVALKGGYHGDTLGAMALSDPNGMHTLFKGMLPTHFFAEQPKIRFGAAMNDADFDSMRVLMDEHGDEIAAVIVEPIFQGGNAMWFYHPEYLRMLRKACEEKGILLIFDEIATGFGRTGKRFALEYAGVIPDILTIGKILTGGSISLAAAITTRHVAETLCDGAAGAFMHGPTYMANPIACAAGCAAMRVMDSYDWQSAVLRIEHELEDQLEPYRRYTNVKDVRVLGAIGVLELNELPTPERVQAVIRETGVWLRPFGHFLYTMPPFVTSSEEMLQITQAMGRLVES